LPKLVHAVRGMVNHATDLRYASGERLLLSKRNEVVVLGLFPLPLALLLHSKRHNHDCKVFGFAFQQMAQNRLPYDKPVLPSITGVECVSKMALCSNMQHSEQKLTYMIIKIGTSLNVNNRMWI